MGRCAQKNSFVLRLRRWVPASAVTGLQHGHRPTKNPRPQVSEVEGRSTQWWFFRYANSLGGSVSVGHLGEVYPIMVASPRPVCRVPGPLQ